MSKTIVASETMTQEEINLWNIMQEAQCQVSNGAFLALKDKLPLPTQWVSIIARMYGVNARFHRVGEGMLSAANLDSNRWTCRTKGNQVTGMSLG